MHGIKPMTVLQKAFFVLSLIADGSQVFEYQIHQYSNLLKFAFILSLSDNPASWVAEVRTRKGTDGCQDLSLYSGSGIVRGLRTGGILKCLVSGHAYTCPFPTILQQPFARQDSHAASRWRSQPHTNHSFGSRYSKFKLGSYNRGNVIKFEFSE